MHTLINIEGEHAGQNMNILTAGDLSIIVAPSSDFYDSQIECTEESTHIILDCSNGRKCSNNTIFGESVMETVTVICGDDADCSDTELHCPSDPVSDSLIEGAVCSLECSLCPNTTVYAEGITDLENDLNWICANTTQSCLGSKFQCNGDPYAELIFDMERREWTFDGDICGITMEPTSSPTVLDLSLDFNF